jgi:hypothetical protein
VHERSSGKTVRVLLGAIASTLLLAAPASAGTTTVLADTTASASSAEWRSCHERLLPSGTAGVAQHRVTTPTGGLVWATTSGASGADWDVAIFEADDGELVAGSASPDANELAEGFALGDQELVVQACLLDGDAGEAALRAGHVDTRVADATGPVQLVRVSTPTPQDKNRLSATGLDLTEHGGPDFVEVVLYGAEDEDRLRAAGFTWTVRIADLVARSAENRKADRAYAAATTRSALPSGRDDYRRLPDYELEMKDMAMRHPGLVRLLVLPHESLEGRQVLGVEIARNVGAQDGRPVFLQMGVHHAREWPSSEHAMEWAHEILNGVLNGDPRATALAESSRNIIVPVVNPDGFNLSREAPIDLRFLADVHPIGVIAAILADPGFAYKRKNCRVADGREPQPGECSNRVQARNRGVDPNRNYGGLWGGPGASVSPTSDIYRGPTPFSEPETQNIRELVSARQVTGLITNHTFSNLVLRPPGVRAQGPPPDEEFLRELGRRMTDQNGYANLKGYELYDTTGTTEDWSYNATRGFGYTFEIGPEEFHPPFEEVVAEWTGETAVARGGGNREAYYVAAETAASPQHHSVIEGTATPGSVIRLHKEFLTPTHDPIYLTDTADDPEVADDTAPGYGFQDVLDTTMVVPESGRFEFHANPSTRPLMAARSYFDLAEEPSRTQSHSNTTPTVPGAGATDQSFYYREFTFEVAPDEVRDFLRVSLRAGHDDDFDLYVYRVVNDEGDRQFMSSSATATGDETAIVENVEPGTYVARVLNWLAVDPTFDLEFALFGRGPDIVRQETPESWTLTCERPGGEILDTHKVFVDAGERVSLEGLCAQAGGTEGPAGPPGSDGAPGAPGANGPGGSNGTDGSNGVGGQTTPGESRGVEFAIPRSGVRMTDSGFVRLRIRCPETERSGCTGVVKVYVDRVRTRASARQRRIKLGEQAYVIQPGRTAVVRVPITRRYQRYVQRRRSARALAVSITRNDRGVGIRRQATFRLRAPRAR